MLGVVVLQWGTGDPYPIENPCIYFVLRDNIANLISATRMHSWAWLGVMWWAQRVTTQEHTVPLFILAYNDMLNDEHKFGKWGLNSLNCSNPIWNINIESDGQEAVCAIRSIINVCSLSCLEDKPNLSYERQTGTPMGIYTALDPFPLNDTSLPTNVLKWKWLAFCILTRDEYPTKVMHARRALNK